jgi:hypothetical protein
MTTDFASTPERIGSNHLDVHPALQSVMANTPAGNLHHTLLMLVSPQWLIYDHDT